MSTRVMTAHVPVELAEKVDRLAAQYDRPRGWIMKQALSAWVGEEEERYRLSLEARESIRAGNFVAQEDMAKWAQNLGGPSPLPPPQPKS